MFLDFTIVSTAIIQKISKVILKITVSQTLCPASIFILELTFPSGQRKIYFMGEKTGDKKLVKKPLPLKFFTRNNNIIFINITAACVLLFCCCFFFFRNIAMFKHDITSYMAFSPILLFAGIIFICVYITILVTKLESQNILHADRLDLPYKIIFSLTLILLIVRSFLGDFMGAGTMLNVPVAIIVLAIISGLATWATPKIKDNNNPDF